MSDKENQEVKDVIAALMWFSLNENAAVSFGSCRTKLHISVVAV